MERIPVHSLRIISWNLTLQCPLHCPHCYANARETEIPNILSTDEGFRVLEAIKEIGSPVVILSGGEPMMRPDLYEIATYGTLLGLRMVLGTSGYLFEHDTPKKLKEAGIRSVAISIDSADPAVHDQMRGNPGSWKKAIQAIQDCIREEIGVQINITVFTPDKSELDRVITLGKELGVSQFQVFIPVPTGRSTRENYERYGTYEGLLRHLITISHGSDITLRPTCIPQFRRVADEMGVSHPHWGKGCIAGISYCRIYADGKVTPCPYLPVIAGDLRLDSFSRIWAESDVFIALRDSNRLSGKCGICEYKENCGGCRARAFSRSENIPQTCGSLVKPCNIDGEICAEDPLCPYQPG
ncbi:MAG: radical SAM protein, partial [Methanospirillum sp.]|uniref:radical SAM/SPASM domain-containing protein n=1 Tax=Methanospirillum sp. TaxID=45200 RepID=UPI00236BAB5D